MKTLLLISKAKAIRDSAKSITLDHFRNALTYGSVTSERARSLLYSRLGDFGPIHTPDTTDLLDQIEMARQAPPLKISQALHELLQRLDAIGEDYFSLDCPDEQSGSITIAARIQKLLDANLLGQQAVIDNLVTTLASKSILGASRCSVAGAFIFAGPTSSGKSLAARLLAEGLGDYPVLEIDCSAFDSPNERFAFDGSPTAYAGARPGRLTSYVRENPKCVVVLDHFTRMNPALQTVLLPVLETGFMTDNHGFFKNDDAKTPEIADRNVDFRQTYLILTTDVGAELYDHPALIDRLLAEGGSPQIESALHDLLRKARNEISVTPGPVFDSAVLSRVLANGSAILFNRLPFAALRTLCARNLSRAAESLITGMGGGDVSLGDNEAALIDMLVLSHGGEIDARKLGADAIARNFLAPVIKRWIHGTHNRQIAIQVSDADTQEICAITDKLGEDPIRTLFRQMKRIQFDTVVKDELDRISLICKKPRLVKIASPADFHGKGSFVIEMPDTRFEDIAGNEALKARLTHQIETLRQAELLAKQGLRPPGGILLYGPPGTGKTSIARALAGEAGLPFLATTATELFDLSFQRQMFEKLRRYAPAILFIDEIDALGKRGGGLDPVINTLLSELDGFGTNKAAVFVVGATNFPEKIDSALLRPGRMELRYEVGLPDRDARKSLLKRGLPHADDLQIERLTDLSSGLSGAAMEAIRRDVLMLRIANPDAEDRSFLPEVMSSLSFDSQESLPDNLRWHVAVHEAGHTLVTLMLCHETDRVDCVRIGKHADTAGRVSCSRNSNGILSRNRQNVRNELMSLLAGRAAQVLCFGDEIGIDNGATNDLARAIELATQAIVRWGIDPILGTEAVAMTAGLNDAPLPEVIVKRIDAWIKEAELAVRSFLEDNRATLELIARRLLSEGALDHQQLVDIVGTMIATKEKCS